MGIITEFKVAHRDDRLLDHFVTHVEDALTWRKRREIIGIYSVVCSQDEKDMDPGSGNSK